MALEKPVDAWITHKYGSPGWREEIVVSPSGTAYNYICKINPRPVDMAHEEVDPPTPNAEKYFAWAYPRSLILMGNYGTVLQPVFPKEKSLRVTFDIVEYNPAIPIEAVVNGPAPRDLTTANNGIKFSWLDHESETVMEEVYHGPAKITKRITLGMITWDGAALGRNAYYQLPMITCDPLDYCKITNITIEE